MRRMGRPGRPSLQITHRIKKKKGLHRMVYITGDTHRHFDRIEEMIWYFEENDVIVILGDVGINYSGFPEDYELKKDLSELPVVLFCVHGNHEMRPENLSSYEQEEFYGGEAYYEPEFPNLIFAKCGEIYDLGGKRCMVIGGANSVDKAKRTPGVDWWDDEQPSEEIKYRVEKRLKDEGWRVDVVLSHTCPAKCFKRLYSFGYTGEKHDISTEKWLDSIEDRLDYDAWCCGHFHTDENIDKVHFFHHGLDEL